VKRLLEIVQGESRVESEVGKGTSFTLLLPTPGYEMPLNRNLSPDFSARDIAIVGDVAVQVEIRKPKVRMLIENSNPFALRLRFIWSAHDPESLKAPGEVLSEAGYMCLFFQDLTSAFSEVFTNPPHFLLFDMAEEKWDLKKAFREVKAQLPETHLYLFSALESRPKIAEYFALDFTTCFGSPSNGEGVGARL